MSLEFNLPPKLFQLPDTDYPLVQPIFAGIPGPYEWNGKFYWITTEVALTTPPNVFSTYMAAYKSSDETATQPFTRIASGETDVIGDVSVFYPGSGSIIYWAYSLATFPAATFKAGTFDMATETFSSGVSVGLSVTGGTTFSLLVSPNGYRAFVYVYIQSAVYHMKAVTSADGITWSAPISLASGGIKITSILVDGQGNIGISWSDGTDVFYIIFDGTTVLSTTTIPGLGDALAFTNLPLSSVYDPVSDSVVWPAYERAGDMNLVVGTPSAAPVFSLVTINSDPDGHYDWQLQQVIAKIQDGTWVFFVWAKNADIGEADILQGYTAPSATGPWSAPFTLYSPQSYPPSPPPDAEEMFPIYGLPVSGDRLAVTIGFFYNFMTTAWCGILAAFTSTPSAALALACPVSNAITIGVPYSGFLIATGGTPPYTFSLVAGSLPPGLSLNTSTGEISGTPTAVGPYSYTARVTDANALTADATCSFGGPGPSPPHPPPICIIFPTPGYMSTLAAYNEPAEITGS